MFLDPTSTAKVIADVKPGQQVTAMGKMSDSMWYLVKRNDKTLGYIPASCLTTKANLDVSQSSISNISPEAPSLPPKEKQTSPQTQCESVAEALSAMEQTIGVERAKKQLTIVEQKWGTECPEEVAVFKNFVESLSVIKKPAVISRVDSNIQEEAIGQNNTSPNSPPPPSKHQQPSSKNQCESVATAFITMERTKKQLEIAEQKWGVECPEQLAIFRKIVEESQADPLAIANVQHASFKELFAALQKSPKHNNAMLGKMLLPQKATTIGDISLLIEMYPEFKTVVEEQAYSHVQSIEDAQHFLRIYADSDKKNEVINAVLKESKSAGPKQFLLAVQAFENHPVPEDLQIWYLETIRDREQFKKLANRFPEAKRAYVENSKTLKELFSAVELYPEHEPYVTENAAEYVASKEDAKLFFAKYPKHSASDTLYEQLAEKAFNEGESSFLEFIQFFPDRKVPKPFIEKYAVQASDLSALSRLIDIHPELKADVEKQACAHVQTIEDAKLFLHIYHDSDKKNEVINTVLKKSKSVGPEQFLLSIQAFEHHPIPKDLQIWYLETIKDREQFRKLVGRFPEAKRAYVVKSKNLKELFAAADLYPEHEVYVADNAAKYVLSKEDAKLFFGRYPKHIASAEIFKQLAENSLKEGRSSFKEFIQFFPNRSIPPSLIQKYIVQAPDLNALIGDATIFPDQAKKEYFNRAQTVADFLAALDFFPEEVEYIGQHAASKVSSTSEAKEYLTVFEKHNVEKNPFEQKMFTSLFESLKSTDRSAFTEVLQEFPNANPGQEQAEWYLRSAQNAEDLDYAIQRVNHENIDTDQLRLKLKAQATLSKHKKIWDECTADIVGSTYDEIKDCLKRITQDEIPTEYARHAKEISDNFTELADFRVRMDAGDPSLKKKVLGLLPNVEWLEEQTMEHCPCLFGQRLFKSTARLRIETKIKEFDFETKTFSLKVVNVTKAPGVSSDYEAYQEAMQILRNNPENHVGAVVHKGFAQIYNSFFWDVYKGKETPSSKGWTNKEFDFLNMFLFSSIGNENELDTSLRLMAQRKNCYASAFIYRMVIDGIKDDIHDYNKWDAAATEVLNSCPQLPVPKDISEEITEENETSRF